MGPCWECRDAGPRSSGDVCGNGVQHPPHLSFRDLLPARHLIKPPKPAQSCPRLALSRLQAAPKAGSALDNHGCRQEQQSHEQMPAECDPAAVHGPHRGLGHQVLGHWSLPANPAMPREVPATGLSRAHRCWEQPGSSSRGKINYFTGSNRILITRPGQHRGETTREKPSW